MLRVRISTQTIPRTAVGERTHKQTHTHTLPLPHVDNMASHSNDGDECKASSHGGTARVGHDLIDHIAHVRAEERRIRDGVHRAHTAFVKGKLPVVQLDTSKWVCSWTRHQLKLWEMLNYCTAGASQPHSVLANFALRCCWEANRCPQRTRDCSVCRLPRRRPLATSPTAPTWWTPQYATRSSSQTCLSRPSCATS